MHDADEGVRVVDDRHRHDPVLFHSVGHCARELSGARDLRILRHHRSCNNWKKFIPTLDQAAQIPGRQYPIDAPRSIDDDGDTSANKVVGLFGIAAGIVTFAWPGITAIVLVLFIGAWALVHGIFEIIGAIQLRKEIDNEWMLILGGLLSVVFGLLVLFAPGAGALGLIWAIAAYSIVFGILFIALALRLRNYRDVARSPTAA